MAYYSRANLLDQADMISFLIVQKQAITEHWTLSHLFPCLAVSHTQMSPDNWQEPAYDEAPE